MTKVTIKPNNQPTAQIVHRIGNWYRHEDGVTLVILANVKGKAVLITTDGHFWTEPVEYACEPLWCVSQTAFEAVTNGAKKFTLIREVTISEE